MNSIEIQDLCNKMEGLLFCLGIVTQSSCCKEDATDSHLYLVEMIKEIVQEIEQLAKEDWQGDER